MKLSNKTLVKLALLITLSVIIPIVLSAVTRNVAPRTDDAYDVGSALFRYRDAMFSRNVTSANFTATEYYHGDGSLLSGVVGGGNSSTEIRAAINDSGSYNITSWFCYYVDNATERSLFTDTFNTTYDAKPDNTYNSTYDTHVTNDVITHQDNITTYNSTYDTFTDQANASTLISLGDNKKMYWGDDDDVCAYFDGTSFIITSSC